MDDCLTPTNSMIGSPFDILKLDGVEDPSIDINKLATIDLEESYFESCVGFINESHKHLTDAKLELYRTISEATEETVVLEGFSDFFSKVKEIIDKFLKFLKSLIDRFLANLAKLINSDKFIKKNKDTILKFDSDCEFDMTGYNYTFVNGVPVPSAILSITDDMFKDFGIAPDGAITAEYVRALNDRLAYDEDWYDEFRGKVLNKDNEVIPASDYSEELFRIFRDDSLDSETITIDSSKVTEAYRRFVNYNDTKKAIQREQRDVEKSYGILKDDIKKLSSKNTMNVSALLGYIKNGAPKSIDGKNVMSDAGFAVSNEFSIAFDVFVKSKVDQVQKCSDIHLLAYGAKLDAMQACLKQDKAVLYAAYNKVRKRGIK